MGSNSESVGIKIKIKVKHWSFVATGAMGTRGGREQTGNNSAKKKNNNISVVLTIPVARQINPVSTAPFTWQPITNKHLPRARRFLSFS